MELFTYFLPFKTQEQVLRLSLTSLKVCVSSLPQSEYKKSIRSSNFVKRECLSDHSAGNSFIFANPLSTLKIQPTKQTIFEIDNLEPNLNYKKLLLEPISRTL